MFSELYNLRFIIFQEIILDVIKYCKNIKYIIF